MKIQPSPFKKKRFLCLIPMAALVSLIIVNCSSSTTTVGGGGGDNDGTTCSLDDDTTATATENAYGCFVLDRDTSSCEQERIDQGLSGFWLKFSCRVTLTVSGSNVVIATDSQPDYKNYYFDSGDACFEDADLADRSANPNTISEKSVSVTVPMTPVDDASPDDVDLGTIGVAVNGVSIFSNEAGPGDDIYDEVATFDLCDGHPEQAGKYHYHTEPSAISNGDEEFVGVMRDGYPVYGRFGHGTSADVAGLDAQGGHTSTTVDSPSVAVYHYHVNLQTNGTDQAYFISAGKYTGTIGACTGCE